MTDQSTTTTPKNCGHCHDCGTSLIEKNSGDGEGKEWCATCKVYRFYPSHGWINRHGETKNPVCPTLRGGIRMMPDTTEHLIEEVTRLANVAGAQGEALKSIREMVVVLRNQVVNGEVARASITCREMLVILDAFPEAQP